MAEDRNEEQFGKPAASDQDKQQPLDQQNQPSELGQQGQSSSGQTDLGQDSDTATLTDQQRGADTGSSDGGFVGSKGNNSSDYLQEKASATEDGDIESGQPNDRDNDIEGGTGA